jgi:hypothetical protein
VAEGRFGWPDSWEELWAASPRFRRMWRVSSVMFGIGTLLDAALRVLMAYTLPPDAVPLLGTVLYAATSVVLIAVNNVYYFTCGLWDRSSALYGGLTGPIENRLLFSRRTGQQGRPAVHR